MRHHFLPLLIGLAMLFASSADATLRSPQVPVAGSALATFFATQGQAIDPSQDQLALQQLSVGTNVDLEVRAFGSDGSAAAGFYNSLATVPPLYPVWPAAATPGWYPVCSFRTGPPRLVVNLFDAASVIQGTATYLGADANAFGVYGQGAAGVVYLQDDRNALGAARILAFDGTGARAGYRWFAIETGSAAGGDFADLIVLVNFGLTPVDVERASWGTLKQRFR